MTDMLQDRATVDAGDTNSYVLAMVLKSDMGKALPSRARDISMRYNVKYTDNNKKE